MAVLIGRKAEKPRRIERRYILAERSVQKIAVVSRVARLNAEIFLLGQHFLLVWREADCPVPAVIGFFEADAAKWRIGIYRVIAIGVAAAARAAAFLACAED